jgi:two-component system cell cycle sensor histidine kinase PleC
MATNIKWQGKPARLSTLFDITERRRAEEDRRLALIDAERANQAKSDFLATMSHELRTPLNAIIGFSDMIEGQFFGALGSEKYKEYAHDIHNSSEHLMALVNDILDLSAIEAGKQPLFKEELIASEVAADCSLIIVNAAAEKNIEFSVDVSDNVTPLWADRRAIKQILFNLLTNAVKYTLEGGEILLKSSATGEFHVFEVKDTGVGVPAEKLSSLTDPFVRTETDPHKAQEGSGLGLAIVKSLVDLHGGELDIKSEVGVGTTVTVTLPSKI